MMTITARCVDEAIYRGAMLMKAAGEPITVRGAETLEYPAPVTTIYTTPRNRVSLSPVRDANPFFHLMESLWILAGREDVGFVSHYNKRIASYSDDGKRFHAAYGARLADQIPEAVALLEEDHTSRRVVLQIWDHEKDLGHKGLDLPCNDLLFLKVRNGRLQLTVCCRSNDMIWGAYGANSVQFSVLQEYLAAKIGAGIGYYRQISDSYHVYTTGAGGKVWERIRDDSHRTLIAATRYQEELTKVPLVKDPDAFDRDLAMMFSAVDYGADPWEIRYEEPFFESIIAPMGIAWEIWKNERDPDKAAASLRGGNEANDWWTAGREWMLRRAEQRTGASSAVAG